MLTYQLSEEDFSAQAVAEQLGLPPEQVFKTLLVTGRQYGPVFVLVSAGSQLSKPRLAALRQERRMEMVPLAQVRGLTGYPRGAVTVPGARKPFPVVADQTARTQTQMAVSAGVRGQQMLVETAAFLDFVGAVVADICDRTGPVGENRPTVAKGTASWTR